MLIIYCELITRIKAMTALNKNNDANSFTATLIRVNGAKIASSNDFESTTGQLKNKNALLLTESQADTPVSYTHLRAHET